MNPIVATQAVQAIEQSKTFAQAKKVIFWSAVGLGTYWVGSTLWRKYRQGKVSDVLATDVNAQYAVAIYTALNSGLFGWFVDEEKLMDIASRIQDWEAVQGYYADITGDNLTTVLSSKLQPSEMTQFNSLLATTGANPGVTTASDTPIQAQGRLAVSNVSLDIRKTPVKETWTFNKIEAVPANTIVGYTTGKEVYYEQPWYSGSIFDAGTKVWFVELQVKDTTGKPHIAYAWKGGLDYLTDAQARQKFGNNYASQIKSFNTDDLSGLNGVRGPQYNPYAEGLYGNNTSI